MVSCAHNRHLPEKTENDNFIEQNPGSNRIRTDLKDQLLKIAEADTRPKKVKIRSSNNDSQEFKTDLKKYKKLKFQQEIAQIAQMKPKNKKILNCVQEDREALTGQMANVRTQQAKPSAK